MAQNRSLSTEEVAQILQEKDWCLEEFMSQFTA